MQEPKGKLIKVNACDKRCAGYPAEERGFREIISPDGKGGIEKKYTCARGEEPVACTLPDAYAMLVEQSEKARTLSRTRYASVLKP